MASTTDFDQLNNPYSSSYAPAVDVLPQEGEEAPLAELRTFVGANADYYLRKWAPRLASPDGETGMNWAAFFLTAIWMGYRKMHLNSVICICAAFGMSIGVELLFVFGFHAPTTPFSVVVVTNLMFCLVCGICANSWYLKHAKRKIAAVQAQGFEGDLLLQKLRQRGGTSILGALGLVFGPVVALLVLGIVLGLALAVVGSTMH